MKTLKDIINKGASGGIFSPFVKETLLNEADPKKVYDQIKDNKDILMTSKELSNFMKKTDPMTRAMTKGVLLDLNDKFEELIKKKTQLTDKLAKQVVVDILKANKMAHTWLQEMLDAYVVVLFRETSRVLGE